MKALPLAITISVITLAGCSNPPASISEASTVVERRQNALWMYSLNGQRSFFAKPGVEDIVVTVYRLPEQGYLSEVRIKTNRGVIPETKVYQIPKGELSAYRVDLAPVGSGGTKTFDIPAE